MEPTLYVQSLNMNIAIRYGVFFSFLVFCLTAVAQVSVNFNASLYGRTLDGLSFTQIINASSQPVYVKVKVTIREMRQGTVATVQIPYFQLKAGTNIISNQNFIKSNFVFANNSMGIRLSQTSKLPEGEFEFCFEITTGDPKTLVITDVSDFCFQSQISPLTPLLLIDPIEGDKFCNTRPNFTWQPPLPLQPATQFRIIVCEKNEKQTDIEAITYNLPIINIGGLYNNTLLYPAKTPELKKDHKYVWQVTAYEEKTILTKSEIWQFEIKCEEEKKEQSIDSYRELKEIEDGNYFVADKILRVSFNNPYNPGVLNYSIVSLSKPDEKVRKLPELKLSAGLNKYEIDLSENSFFKKDEEYLITVRLENNRVLKLRFIYTDDEHDFK
jgi:hypothetical protein